MIANECLPFLQKAKIDCNLIFIYISIKQYHQVKPNKNLKNLLYNFSRNQTRVGKEGRKGEEGTQERAKNKEQAEVKTEEPEKKGKNKTKQPHASFLPYRWALVSSL